MKKQKLSKEQISAGAKKNRIKGDEELEKNLELVGSWWAMWISNILAIVMVTVERLRHNKWNYGVAALAFLMTGLLFLIKGISLKRWWQIVLGAFFTLFAILTTIGFFIEVFV